MRTETRLERGHHGTQGKRARQRQCRRFGLDSIPGGSGAVKPLKQWALLGLSTAKSVEKGRGAGLEPTDAGGNVVVAARQVSAERRRGRGAAAVRDARHWCARVGPFLYR